MSLLSVSFVGTGADTALHVVAGVVLVATIAAACYGFWRIHELPINKAHSKEHHQLGLITALTWIGFIWHWVWVLAVIVSFVDMEKAIINLRDTWRAPSNTGTESTSNNNANTVGNNVNSTQSVDNKENPAC
ncbi:MFS transporter [Vibrio lentus]|uniref:MFS transporter n=1 Tax=Vibrio lentus TaxID=136468 RepID=A0AA45A7D4_9VIBR|nr:MFS transporter [Vibrio lentus]MCB5361157.1 MFS transporter [Vibrio lentus]MCB5451621.1 MFS transporter [Vibrio lentus]MCB5462892.1 MFS transporter [Vibrio lentus]MCC4794185.1 MFS transporter [Vibrio lentus]MCC4850446.1 MFS transporter [Vibrio lentus]